MQRAIYYSCMPGYFMDNEFVETLKSNQKAIARAYISSKPYELK